MAFRFEITGGDPTPEGNVVLYAQVYTEAGEEWVIVPGGAVCIKLSGLAIGAITQDGELSDAQKRAALLALFKEQVAVLGIQTAKVAYDELYALLPAGWPVTVNL